MLLLTILFVQCSVLQPKGKLVTLGMLFYYLKIMIMGYKLRKCIFLFTINYHIERNVLDIEHATQYFCFVLCLKIGISVVNV